jgi:hypothetical protein
MAADYWGPVKACVPVSGPKDWISESSAARICRHDSRRIRGSDCRASVSGPHGNLRIFRCARMDQIEALCREHL